MVNDFISFSAKQGIYTVTDISDNIRTVQLYPTEICSCPIEKHCHHILAVKLAQGQQIKVDGTKTAYNITQMRKNTRANKRAKPGRKKPRAGDEDEGAQPRKRSKRIRAPVRPTREHDYGNEESDVKERLELSVSPDVKDAQSELVNLLSDDSLSSSAFGKINPAHSSSTPVHSMQCPDEPIDLSFIRDIEYSKEVWISAGGVLSTNLNIQDRSIVMGEKGNGWLSDLIIDASMEIICNQNPNIGTYQTCSHARSLSFKKQTGTWTVIINTDSRGPGEHWILCTNVGAKEDHIFIHDSARKANVPGPVRLAIANIGHFKSWNMVLQVTDVDRQRNGNDCGVLAIANMVALAHDLPVGKQKYATPKEMRTHLRVCLELKKFSPFPTQGTRKSKGVLNVISVELFCSCKMPEAGKYFKCARCQLWYHLTCQAIDTSLKKISKTTPVHCLQCKVNPEKHKKNK